jgi:hypothetical protein
MPSQPQRDSLSSLFMYHHGILEPNRPFDSSTNHPQFHLTSGHLSPTQEDLALALLKSETQNINRAIIINLVFSFNQRQIRPM